MALQLSIEGGRRLRKPISPCAPALLLALLLQGCLLAVDAPLFHTPVPHQSVGLGQTLQLDLAEYASDPEERPLTYSVLEPSPGEIAPGTSLYLFVPTIEQLGEHAVTVAATNGLRDVRASFTVVVSR